MATGKRLGRGLEALLGRIDNTGSSETEHTDESSEGQDWTARMSPASESEGPFESVTMSNQIDITKIEPNPFQPRRVFDQADLEELSQSLHIHGLLQPITVRRAGERFQIVAGERRFRAALRMGWSEITAQICEADDQMMTELALTENLQRKDLNAIEKASSFAAYLETYPGTTHEELANRLAISRSSVTNMLRLLDLPQQLQDAVCQEQLTSGHVRALLKLSEWEQLEVASKIQAEGWNVRETERFVQDLLLTGEGELPKSPEQTWRIVDQDGSTKAVPRQSEQMLQLEEEFRHFLGGMKVKLVQTNDKGKGKLVISFSNHAEFEQIYAAICHEHRAVG